MEHNRLKAKEEVLYYTQEIVQALKEADIVRLSIAREKLLENADIVFADENDKLNVYKVVASSYTGTYNQAAALPIVKKIVKISKEIYKKNSPEQVEAYDLLANTCYAAERYEDALKLAKELYRYYEKKRGISDRKTIKIYSLIGMCYWKRGNYEKAMGIVKTTYLRGEEYLGASDIDTLNYRRELAMCYYYIGKIKEAYYHIVRAYDICMLTYGEQHSITLLTSQYHVTISSSLSEKEKLEAMRSGAAGKMDI